MSELSTLTDHQKCRSIFRAVCEGVDCELTYAELQALEEHGFITNLKRVKRNRWSFEWTDILEQYAKASPSGQAGMIRRLIGDTKL